MRWSRSVVDIKHRAFPKVAGKLPLFTRLMSSLHGFYYVQEGVYEKFVEAFVARTNKLKVGDGMDKETRMGPLAQSRRVAAVSRFIDDAQERGATLLTGGKPLEGAGNFFAPTVLTDLADNSLMMTEEPFGPVAGIVRFKDLGDAIQRANSLPFGLAAYGYTTSTRNANAIANGIESGMISINHLGMALAETPFGGIKDSGTGSEGGTESFDGYLNTKFVTQLN